jgi:hypothetical protein
MTLRALESDTIDTSQNRQAPTLLQEPGARHQRRLSFDA